MTTAVFALGLVRVLPPSLGTLLSRFLVIFYLGLRADYRREIRNNLRAFGIRAGRLFWVRNGWHVGRNLALMTQVGTRRGSLIVDRVEILGENINRATLEQDVLTVMASFHFGAWEYLPRVFSRKGCPVAVLTGVQKQGKLTRAIERLRAGTGVEMVRGVRGLLRAPGGIVGFMLDNTSRGARVQAETGATRFSMPALPFKLGPSLVPAFASFEKGRLRVRVYPPGDANGALYALKQQVMNRPEEWVWWGKAGAAAEPR